MYKIHVNEKMRELLLPSFSLSLSFSLYEYVMYVLNL